MWDPIIEGAMPGFWPPRLNRCWSVLLEPLRRFYLKRYYGIAGVQIEGMDEAFSQVQSGDGVLITPNHSHDSDPHVMMDVGHHRGRGFYFMAAWQVFLGHKGIDGWVMQRMGAFSVDREGCDRRALKMAQELLEGGQSLVVFPEGEIFHLNGRLTPIKEGVAFMALAAQRDLSKHTKGGRVWIIPTAIRYQYVGDIRPLLDEAMTQLEKRLVIRGDSGMTLQQRLLRFGEFMLTIKEKEKLGRSGEGEGDLPTRVARLREAILAKLETKSFGKMTADDTVPMRIKALRRHLLEIYMDEKAEEATRNSARNSLADVQLALQLYSYPGDYITEEPTIERMAETVEKFEEDINGIAMPKGKRRALVRMGPPIDVSRFSEGRLKASTAALAVEIEEAIRGLMRGGAAVPPGPGSAAAQ